MVIYTEQDHADPAAREAICAFLALLREIDPYEHNGHYCWMVFERAQELAAVRQLPLDQLTLADMREVHTIAREDFATYMAAIRNVDARIALERAR